MKKLFLFIFLFTLSACQYPGSTEPAFEAKRQERKKQLSKEIKECILKKEISLIFQDILDEKPNDLIWKLYYKNRELLDENDKKIYISCNNEKHNNYIKQFLNKRYYKALKRGYHPPDPNGKPEPIE